MFLSCEVRRTRERGTSASFSSECWPQRNPGTTGEMHRGIHTGNAAHICETEEQVVEALVGLGCYALRHQAGSTITYMSYLACVIDLDQFRRLNASNPPRFRHS